MSLQSLKSTATAHPNIALIKYWGNRDTNLRLPSNGSISLNLADLITRTTVHFSPEYHQDSLTLNNQPGAASALDRVSQFLDVVRNLAGVNLKAQVISTNNFPTSAGIASSASAFAALALAASGALGLGLSESELSRLARRGSGSACRSIPAGYVEWKMGTGDEDSYAESIAPPNHWDLVDLVAIVHQAHKATGSSEGHIIADTSPLNPSRLQDAPRRLDSCRQAILARDFDALAQVVELDCNLMHAVMMTSTPPLFYWEPATIRLLKLVPEWRKQGYPVCYTVDAGPNVHVICPRSASLEIQKQLEALKCVTQLIPSGVGGAVQSIPG